MNLSSLGRRLLQIADAASFRSAIGVSPSGSDYSPGGTDVAVTDGGTGVSALTAYALIAGGTTSTGPVQSLAGLGTATQVLTSNGPGALPTFQAAPAAGGYTLLGTITTTSGSSQSLSSLTLTSYKFLRCVMDGVSGTLVATLNQNSRTIGATSTSSVGLISGILEIDLSTGASFYATGGTANTTASAGGGPSAVTTASTAITFSLSTGTFDAGTIKVYAI